MKYKNAKDILPDKLLRELQEYISGGVLYVPHSGEKSSGERIPVQGSITSNGTRKFRQRIRLEKILADWQKSIT